MKKIISIIIAAVAVLVIGCGIAGFCDDEIAPLFKEAQKLENVWLPTRFWE